MDSGCDNEVENFNTEQSKTHSCRSVTQNFERLQVAKNKFDEKLQIPAEALMDNLDSCPQCNKKEHVVSWTEQLISSDEGQKTTNYCFACDKLFWF